MTNGDVVVVGGGIVGLATAWSLSRRGRRVVVFEAENEVGLHQSGRNSGVVHSGLYYRPGSLKARLCVTGREAILRFCAENDLPFQRCGKVVVATTEDEVPRLEELERRGRANGLKELRRLGPEALREREPAATGIAALEVGETGICDFKAVARRLAECIRDAGGEVRTGARVLRGSREGPVVRIETAAGDVRASRVVNAAGLQSDRVARALGARPEIRIIPFRGEYVEIVPERRDLVRHLIYPVPDPRFPFLGVHFTRTVHGELEAGPNAVLALKREGYRWRDVSVRDVGETLTWPGFWHLARRYGRTGADEVMRSLSRRRFVAALQRLVPELRADDVRTGGSGVRAQAVSREGKLLDDFALLEDGPILHVLNAPSPAATASLAIGEVLADKLT